MATSFFEKLTGASGGEEEVEVSETTPEKISRRPATKKTRLAASLAESKRESKRGKTIKKDSLDMPEPKKKQINKKAKEKELKEKPSLEEIPEGKDWLEEVDGEEGQLTIDVYQTESDIVIKSTIAGVSPEDIDISITNDMVTIKGKRIKDERVDTENYYYQELYWGAFSRSVILPVEVDADRAKASIKNGILTIKLPKSEKVKTKKIRVSTAE